MLPGPAPSPWAGPRLAFAAARAFFENSPAFSNALVKRRPNRLDAACSAYCSAARVGHILTRIRLLGYGSLGRGRVGMTITLLARCCSLAAIALLVFAALGPAAWQVRTGLGWQVDHFLAYFVVTPIFCLAWRRPFVVGGALMVIGALLEGLQAFTPDRMPSLVAAFWGASGALAAALIAELFIRAQRALWAQAFEIQT